MPLAAKHYDVVIGIDIHLVTTPVGPVPVPHPFVGMVLDPSDFIPFIGSTIKINGVHRGLAGSEGGAATKHIPIGGPSFLKPPDNDCEIYMGSSKVTMDGEVASYLGLPVLSCSDIGMPPPSRGGGKKKGSGLKLPTSVILPIPAGPLVNVMGSPTISLQALAMKCAFSVLGKALKSAKKALGNSKRIQAALKKFKKFRQTKFQNMPDGFLKCKILRAEPINSITGEMLYEATDFELPWRIPLSWTRTYGSQNTYKGVCGHGWETPADARIDLQGDTICFSDGALNETEFILEGTQALDPISGLRLKLSQGQVCITNLQGLSYYFKLAKGKASAKIAKLEDLAGNTVQFHWHANHYLDRIEESSGITLVAQNDDKGNLLSLTMYHPEAEQAIVLCRYDYSSNSNLIGAYDREGRPHQFSYESHRIVRHRDRNGLEFNYQYNAIDGLFKCTHTWGDNKLYNYRFDYQSKALCTKVTDSLGAVTEFYYNENFLPVEEINPLGERTCFQYDEFGRTVTVINPVGERVSFTYDHFGNVTKQVDPAGNSEKNTYDEQGRLIEQISPVGGKTQITWGPLGKISQIIDECEALWCYRYNLQGDLIELINPLEQVTQFSYNRHGLHQKITEPGDRQSQFSTDPMGNILRLEQNGGRVSHFSYNKQGLLCKSTSPSGLEQYFSYDAEGQLITHTDEAKRTTRYSYFGLGQVSGIKLPDGSEQHYQYDSEERLIAVRNELGKCFNYRRDALGRVLQTTDYWGQHTHYSYNQSGDIASKTDALGRITRYEYDANGRLLGKYGHDGSAELYEYDALGNIIYTANGAIEIRRTYDPAGRLLEETQGKARVGYQYDPLGRVIARESDLGNTVGYSYHAAGQLASVSFNEQVICQRQYDVFGDPVRDTLAMGLQRQRQYDAEHRLIGQTLSHAEQVLVQRNYHYDKASNLIAREHNLSGRQSFTYDPLGRITQWQDTSKGLSQYYDWDKTGNLLKPQLPQHEEAFRSASFGELEHHYDAVGQVFERRRADGLEQRLEWDGDSRLKQVSPWGNSTEKEENKPAETAVCFSYDPLGRRVGKTQGQQVSRFVWDGDLLLYDTKGEQLREIIYHPQSYEPIAAIVDGQLVYYEVDNNQLPWEIVGDAGELLWQGRFDALGRCDSRNWLSALCFPGQYFDEETGLCYNRHRYYDFESASFLSQDPISLAGGVNLYAYGPNVWGWVDPLGLNYKCGGGKSSKVAKTAELAKSVPDKFKCNGACKEFAGDLQKKMQGAGINGQRLDMETGTSLIFSNKNKVISENGTHSAIKVGDTVFDNLNPKGTKFTDWIDDLGGKEFTNPPHAIIRSTDF